MKNYSRCREKMEGRIGRYRTYKCRSCGNRFRLFLVEPLTRRYRICPVCREKGVIG